MILMLLDHLRETWLVLVPMPDPVDASTVLPALAIARFAASFCAPIFVALTGLSAYLFSVSHSRGETTAFLVKRGLLLMAIDLFYLSPLYWGVVPQPTFWLQVIWCLGLCMILLAGLIRLPDPPALPWGWCWFAATISSIPFDYIRATRCFRSGRCCISGT
ncbi:heparan-alpha-glucosaminide N-acetyltransferase domain-containing protein [Sphingomonas aurantiaca]|uniref:heparan-alpha-glucosaminide N-acetyltransferase domain-containing protein n=1 Tax=Sphingomonas aurantiaca TaxID=185949 RepID=UPI002FDF9C24